VSGVVVIIVRNAELGAALGFLFDTLWTSAVPIEGFRTLLAEAEEGA
jgi:hypothetical protein